MVVDEFHHAEAATYRRLLDHLTPVELLGLTATPERTDGVDVRAVRRQGRLRAATVGRTRVATCCARSTTSASATTPTCHSLTWRRGDYDTSGLTQLYTGNDARVRIILQQIRDKIVDPLAMRALGFCVSVAHAEYMARALQRARRSRREPSRQRPRRERARSRTAALKAGEVNVLFAVDLFNEGLDVPDVDTLLLLRPTQSATIFLQQLGRGLRRTADKPVLTVLDFIGQQRREFRFDLEVPGA